VGARPQFIKAATLSRIFNSRYKNQVEEIIVHSGQHYDSQMSEVFFTELQIPKPKYNLEVGSGSHAQQTAQIGMALEPILQAEKPDIVIVFGDTNTTLAGAITAAKLNIPIAHIESGLRSFNNNMPEEINRIITDRLSTFLFCPTDEGVKNLQNLGSKPQLKTDAENPWVVNCGDVMFDSSLFYRQQANDEILKYNQLKPNEYVLATLHRDFNTDNKTRLLDILTALDELAEDVKIVLPLHPRTVQKMKDFGIEKPKNIKLIKPVSYLEMLSLEAHAKFIITDSGGVQKEAFFFKKPSVILRNETEWTEIVKNGTAQLCDADPAKIKTSFGYFMSQSQLNYPDFYGNGNAADLICETLVNQLK